MSDDTWAEVIYVGLILIGVLVVANAVLWLLNRILQLIVAWLDHLIAKRDREDKQTATLARIAETLERIEADRAAGR